MDLYAYSQIDDLDSMAKANGIVIPRLRGYRLMSEEQPASTEEINEAARQHELYLCEKACSTIPRFCPDSCMSELSSRTDKVRSKYCVRVTRKGQRGDGNEYSYKETIAFRWNLLHGKNRRALKFAIKNGRKDAIHQLRTFNKYVGRDDVLYIHARIGGRNWSYYGGPDLEKQPWFLEKVDDYFDSTYCDIYVLVDKSKCLPVDKAPGPVI